jgi:hypothetical protein
MEGVSSHYMQVDTQQQVCHSVAVLLWGTARLECVSVVLAAGPVDGAMAFPVGQRI